MRKEEENLLQVVPKIQKTKSGREVIPVQRLSYPKKTSSAADRRKAYGEQLRAKTKAKKKEERKKGD